MYYDAKITPQFFISSTRALAPIDRAVAVDLFLTCVAQQDDRLLYDGQQIARLCGVSEAEITPILRRLEDACLIELNITGSSPPVIIGVTFTARHAWGAV